MAQRDLNVSLGLRIENFLSNIKKVERNLDRMAKRMETVGRNMTQAISIPLAGIAAGALGSFGEMERLQNALAAVMGDAGAAAAEMERLRETATKPGLGFEQAVKASARLQAVGLQAAFARDVIEQFGNAVARSGGGAVEFDQAILALTQVASKGKISAEEINQLNERIFEIRPALVAAFGTADSKALENLGVSSEEFISKVTDQFRLLERVNGGLANSFDNFRDNVKSALSELGKSIAQTFQVEDRLNRVATVVSNAAIAFKNLDEGTRRTILRIAGIAAAAGPAVVVLSKIISIGSGVVGAFRNIVGTAKDMVSGVYDAVKGLKAMNATMAVTSGLKLAGLGVAIGVIISLFDTWQKRIENALAGQRALSEVTTAAEQSIVRERLEVEGLQKILESENATREEKEAAIRRLKAINNDYFGQLDVEKSKIEEVTAATTLYIQELLKQAKIKAAEERLIEIEKALLDVNKAFEEATPTVGQSFLNALVAGGNAFYAVGQDVKTWTKNAKDNRDALVRQKDALVGLLTELQGANTVDRFRPTGDTPAPTPPGPTPPGSGKKQLAGTIAEIQRIPTIAEDVLRKVSAGISFTFTGGLVTWSKNIKEVLYDLKSLSDTPLIERMNADFEKMAKVIPVALSPMRQLGKTFSDIEAQAEFLGPSFDLVAEKLTAAQQAFDSAIQGGNFSQAEQIRGVITELENLQIAAQNSKIAGDAFNTALVSGFDMLASSLADGTSNLKSFAAAVIQAGRQVISVFIKEGVAGLVKNILAGPTGKALGPFAIAIAGAAGAAASGLFNTLLNKISPPKLATGGLAYGPTLATVGDNPGARVNPEVIAPLDKLRSMMGGAMRVTGEFTVRGQDLILVLDRAKQEQVRIR